MKIISGDLKPTFRGPETNIKGPETHIRVPETHMSGLETHTRDLKVTYRILNPCEELDDVNIK